MLFLQDGFVWQSVVFGVVADLVDDRFELGERHQRLRTFEAAVPGGTQRTPEIADIARIDDVDVRARVEHDVAAHPRQLRPRHIQQLPRAGMAEEQLQVPGLARIGGQSPEQQIEHQRTNEN